MWSIECKFLTLSNPLRLFIPLLPYREVYHWILWDVSTILETSYSYVQLSNIIYFCFLTSLDHSIGCCALSIQFHRVLLKVSYDCKSITGKHLVTLRQSSLWFLYWWILSRNVKVTFSTVVFFAICWYQKHCSLFSTFLRILFYFLNIFCWIKSNDCGKIWNSILMIFIENGTVFENNSGIRSTYPPFQFKAFFTFK